MLDDEADDGLMAKVPADWIVWGTLPSTPGPQPPLEVSSPDGAFSLRVAWEADAFLGDARIAGHESCLRAVEPTAVREWVLAVLEHARRELGVD